MKLKKNLYILSCRAQVLLNILVRKFFNLLAKCHLVVEHRKSCSQVRDINSPTPIHDIMTDRFVFEVTYINREIEIVDEHWFATKKGKKLYVVRDHHHKSGKISYRANLTSFYAHFSPKLKRWVHHHAPIVHLEDDRLLSDLRDIGDDPISPIKNEQVKTHRCDFSQCRFAFEFSYELDNAGRMPSEVIHESYKVLKNGLTSKIPEINKILTGADCDGEMLSPKKMPMSENLLCKLCGLPVFASARNKYQFECLKHGELCYSQVERVDPVRYKKVLEYNFDYLESLIQKSCPQD